MYNIYLIKYPHPEPLKLCLLWFYGQYKKEFQTQLYALQVSVFNYGHLID